MARKTLNSDLRQSLSDALADKRGERIGLRVTKLPRKECARHPGTFLTPNREKRGHKVGCWRCRKDSLRKTSGKRAQRWNTEFIPCKRHPERRCQKAFFLATGTRRCAGCRQHLADGSLRPAARRHKNVQNYNRSMWLRKRGRWGTRTLQGLKLFARLTGYDYSD